MNVQARQPLNSVLIIGGGIAALLAACALKRALPRSRITMLAGGRGEEGLADLSHSSTPYFARFCQKLGIDEAGLLIRAEATHRLATRYQDWAGNRGFWIGYGTSGEPGLQAATRSRWIHDVDQVQGGAPGLSIGAALAQSGNFSMPQDDPASPLSELDYALRFDLRALTRHLLAFAGHLGITILDDEAINFGRNEDGSFAHVASARGAKVEGDLFILCRRCSPQGLDAEEARRIDWSSFLPVDRVAVGEVGPALSLKDEITGTPHGYKIVSPGRANTRTMFCFSSQVTDGTCAASSLGAEPRRLISFSPGRSVDPWIHNLIRIGDAAAEFEPLGWLNLHHAVHQLRLVLEMLPGKDIDPGERREFNRRSNAMTDRLMDWIAAHYAVPAMADGPFWRRCKQLVRSETLTRILDQFGRRGRLPPQEEESLSRDLWVQLLAGVGYGAGRPPRLLAMPQEQVDNIQRAFESKIRAAIQLAQPYPEFLRQELQESRR